MNGIAGRFALIGEDSSIAVEFCSFLSEAGIAVERFACLDGIATAKIDAYDAVFLAPAPNLHELILGLLRQLKAACPDTPLVVMTSDSDLPLVSQLLRRGVSDMLRVPFTRHEAVFVARKALLVSAHAEEQPVAPIGSVNLQTHSVAMNRALELADRAAASLTTVLIRGESGVGKEVIAERIHARSSRANAPFIKVHCAALPEQILESELFGYEKGAFTGAMTRKPGRFELAAGGTIFLDEIGDISGAVQVKLLRVLQDKTYERLGGTQVLKADVRVVAATHRNLERMLKTGEFRQDLFYRLNVLPIEVPPLRKRPDHVAALARHFCQVFSASTSRAVGLTAPAVDALVAAPWPGNVRQLQNMIERLVVLSDGPNIDESDVRAQLHREEGSGAEEGSNELSAVELSRVVQQAERRALVRALERAGGNRVTAARLLGVSRRTLFYKMREHKV